MGGQFLREAFARAAYSSFNSRPSLSGALLTGKSNYTLQTVSLGKLVSRPQLFKTNDVVSKRFVKILNVTI